MPLMTKPDLRPSNENYLTATGWSRWRLAIVALAICVGVAPENAIAHIAPDGRSFYIYPNPAKNKISVVVNNTSGKQAAIAITDQGGKQLYRQQLNDVSGNYKYDIDIHSFPGGVYYLQMITDKGIKTGKFIKD